MVSTSGLAEVGVAALLAIGVPFLVYLMFRRRRLPPISPSARAAIADEFSKATMRAALAEIDGLNAMMGKSNFIRIETF